MIVSVVILSPHSIADPICSFAKLLIDMMVNKWWLMVVNDRYDGLLINRYDL